MHLRSLLQDGPPGQRESALELEQVPGEAAEPLGGEIPADSRVFNRSYGGLVAHRTVAPSSAFGTRRDAVPNQFGGQEIGISAADGNRR